MVVRALIDPGGKVGDEVCREECSEPEARGIRGIAAGKRAQPLGGGYDFGESCVLFVGVSCGADVAIVWALVVSVKRGFVGEPAAWAAR